MKKFVKERCLGNKERGKGQYGTNIREVKENEPWRVKQEYELRIFNTYIIYWQSSIYNNGGGEKKILTGVNKYCFA